MNIHKTFRRRPGRVLTSYVRTSYVFCLRQISLKSQDSVLGFDNSVKKYILVKRSGCINLKTLLYNCRFGRLTAETSPGIWQLKTVHGFLRIVQKVISHNDLLKYWLLLFQYKKSLSELIKKQNSINDPIFQFLYIGLTSFSKRYLYLLLPPLFRWR